MSTGPDKFTRTRGRRSDQYSTTSTSPSPSGYLRVPRKAESNNPEGRPCSLTDDIVRQAFVATSESGATNEQLALLFDVHLMTISLWLRNGRRDIAAGEPDTKYARFLIAVKSGQDEWNNREAEGALLKRVTGFAYEEVSTTEVTLKGKDAATGVFVSVPAVSTTRTIKQVLPDTTAIMFLLQNRAGHRWKNVRRVEVDGKMDHRHLHAQLSSVVGPPLPIGQLSSKSRRQIDLSKLSDRELDMLARVVDHPEEVAAEEEPDV